jgi:hypothetical protein
MFNEKLFTKKLSKLFEGGNAPFIDRETGEMRGRAGKVSITEMGRDRFVNDFVTLFSVINNLYNDKYGEYLWPKFDVVTSGHAFNGSSEAIFNKQIPDEEIEQHKPVVGDIDITIPRRMLGQLFDLLTTVEGKPLTKEIIYLGNNKKNQHGHQINAVFSYRGYNVQIDFEGSDYKDNKPTEFAKFSHSAHWDDIKKGFKGVYHKLLLINLVRSISEKQDIIIVTPASTPEKIRVKKMVELPRELAFSVDRGLRVKVAPFLDVNGKQIKVSGKDAYKELETSESEYSTHIPDIFFIVFKKKPTKDELQKFGSFSGLVELAKEKLTTQQKEKLFDYILNNLWGKGAQGFEANNPQLDTEIKMKLVDYLKTNFQLTGVERKIEDMKTEFIKNYRTAQLAP